MVENGAEARGSDSSIVEALSGKTILLTGVTGFLAQVVFERLMADFHETRVILLVRSQTGATSRERVEYLLRKPAFDTLRERVGQEQLVKALDERVDVIDADFGRGVPEIPGGIDIACHSAATVAFDPPIDEGFTTNLQGAMNLYGGVIAGGSTPALVHVSTAYVAGVQKGVIPEGPLDHRVDYRLELELAMEARHDVEAQSRKPEMLNAFLAAARKEHERAGPSTVATDAEERRQKWVTKRLVEYGRARARSLGWPDVYTFTKAMGERAVEELAAEANLPLSIVRPSIIESAYTHPYPGWIDGFKMADPIIRAYGLGQIPEFPGIAEGIIDIIPVDFVVNAILAVAANPPPAGEAAHYNVSSGSRNPLRFFELYEWIKGYFEEHPLPERGRGEHKVPDWDFPGNLTVERMLRRAERFTDIAEQVVTHMPKSKAMRDAVRRVDRDKARVDFVKRYSDLYGMYTETEVVYTDDRTFALFESHERRGQGDVPVRCRDGRLEVLPEGRALPGGDAEPARAEQARPRTSHGEAAGARGTGARRVRHGGHDHHVERRGVLRVDADGGPSVGGMARGARERVRQGAAVPADRPSRPRGLPAHVLPPVRRRQRRGDRPPGGEPRRRVHAAEGQLRGDPAHPRPPRRRASHGLDHRRSGAVHPPVGAAVRRADRGGAGGARRALHRVHVAATVGG